MDQKIFKRHIDVALERSWSSFIPPILFLIASFGGVYGAYWLLIFVPLPLYVAARRVLRARRGDVLVTGRGIWDQALPVGWIAWSTISEAEIPHRTERIIFFLKANKRASVRLNEDAGIANSELPGRVVIHTISMLDASRNELYAVIRKRFPGL